MPFPVRRETLYPVVMLVPLRRKDEVVLDLTVRHSRQHHGPADPACRHCRRDARRRPVREEPRPVRVMALSAVRRPPLSAVSCQRRERRADVRGQVSAGRQRTRSSLRGGVHERERGGRGLWRAGRDHANGRGTRRAQAQRPGHTHDCAPHPGGARDLLHALSRLRYHRPVRTGDRPEPAAAAREAVSVRRAAASRHSLIAAAHRGIVRCHRCDWGRHFRTCLGLDR